MQSGRNLASIGYGTVIILALAIFGHATIENPAVMPKPPMGFNNWARFMCDLNETLFTTTADAMASTGLLAAGYNRLNLDDCWMQTSRAANGSLQWNTTLFPQGMPWLAQHVKTKGFHFGIYEDSGNLTCGGYPGSLGYEELDAKTFASWGIDYLKLDGCNVYAKPQQTLQERYKELYGLWHSVLAKMSKPLIFSESAPAYFSGGSDFPNQTSQADWHHVMQWAPTFGELARHSNDIAVYGLYQPQEYWESIMTNYEYELRLARYQGPGFYNDPDFLIADWPWLTLDEKKSQFALWASFSAPLILSAYVPALKKEEIAYLTNKDIIAVDQDDLGLQATLASRDKDWDVLTKSLANGDRLLTVLNRQNKSATTSIQAERIGLSKGSSFLAMDLWTGKLKSCNAEIKVTLRPHATAIYRLSNVTDVAPTGLILNTALMKCFTSSSKEPLTIANCTASDSQIWRVRSALLSPLSGLDSCLSDNGGNVTLQTCDDADAKQNWIYMLTGNVVNRASKRCLTQAGSNVNAASCGDELDSQVFGLPSGVKALRPELQVPLIPIVSQMTKE